MIRYHLDENVDHAIAHGLRLRGMDVTTTSDVGLIAATDPEHIAFAMADNRVISTQDQDFLRRHAAETNTWGSFIPSREVTQSARL